MSELEIWNELGNIYFNTGAYNEAARAYEKVIDLDPACAHPYSNLASILIRNGRPAQAIPLLLKGIELLDDAGGKARLWNQVGDAYQELDDFSSAYASYRKAVEFEPDNPEYQKNLSHALKASQTFLSGSKIGSNQDDALSAKSEPAEWNSPRMDESGNEAPEPLTAGMDLEIESRPSLYASAQGLLRLGLQNWRKGEYERAIQFLKTALDTADKTYEHFLEALSCYAIAYVETDRGRIEEAIRSYQDAANLAPERIFPWNKLGSLYYQLGRYEDARAALQQSVEHNPKDPVGWNGLGDVYHRLGRNEDAIAAYQLGNAYADQPAEEDPLLYFEKSMEAEQGNPQAWSEAGDIYFFSGIYAEAVDSYRKAVEMAPGNAAFHASLSKALKALEQRNIRNEAGSPPNLPGASTKHLPTQEQIDAMADTQPCLRSDRQSQGEEALIEEASTPVEAVANSESEGSYWMFKSTPQPVDLKQPAHFPPEMAETMPVLAHHSRLYALQTTDHPVTSGGRGFTHAEEHPATVLVQLPPRPVKPVGMQTFTSPPPVDDHTDRSQTAGNSGKPMSSSIIYGNSTSTPSADAVENKSSDRLSPDLKVVESDIAAYRKVTEINPLNDRAWDTLGNMYGTSGLYSEAIAAFERAIALSPGKEAYHYHLGIALAYQKRYEDAIQALQRVIELNPDYMLAHCALAGYYRRLGKEAEAEKHAAIARPSMADESEYNQACFESISGNTDRALELLDVALEKHQIEPALVHTDPDLDFIRSDARFEELLSRERIINL